MKITRAGVDRSTNYFPAELDAISIILAGWDGEVGQGTVPVPDPAGNQEPYEGEQLLLEQDSLTITDGFLGMVVSERGDSVTGTRRVHTMTLFDDNALLAGHATPGWARPAEAPAARWAAFVDDFLPGSIDTTWLLTTNESGITLPKKTYRTDSLFDDLSADTIGPTGKTVYIEHRRFHWHLPTEGQTCSLSIHDTTYNMTTSFFPQNPTRSKDGMDLRTKIYARNNAGVIVEVSDATAISRHEAAGLKHHGYSEYDTETAAEMTRDINVTLLERKQERITYGYTIGPLTAAQAVALIPGSQMTVTVGLHGLSAAVKRIARVTLTYHHGRVPYFMATVELGYPRRVKRKPTKQSSAADSSGGSGVDGGGCGGCIPFDASTPQHWYFGTYTFATNSNLTVSGTAGELGGGAGDATIFSDNTAPVKLAPDTGYTYSWGVIIGPEDGVEAMGMVPSASDFDFGESTLGTTGTFGTSGPIIGIAATATTGSGVDPLTDFYMGVKVTGLKYHDPLDPTPADHTINVTYWIDPDWFVAPSPSSGQLVYNDRHLADGTTTTFSTAFAYRPGTLHVKVNGIENTDDVTATDGTTVTFAHPPKLNADIVFDYEAA